MEIMNLYHKDTGKGPVLLLLHGFCESHKVWIELIPELSKHFRLLMPDLPGFGQSEPLPDSFTLADVASTIVQWLTSRINEPVVVIGHSLGGYISLAMVHAHPTLFEGLALFQSTAYADTDEKKAGRDRTIDEIEAHGIPEFVRAFIPRLFLDKTHPSIPGLIRDAQTLPQGTVKGYVRAMRDRPDRKDVLRALGPRALLLGGADDTFVTVGQLKAQQQLATGIKCEVLERSVHMGMLENPQNSMNSIQSFANQWFSLNRTRGGTK